MGAFDAVRVSVPAVKVSFAVAKSGCKRAQRFPVETTYDVLVPEEHTFVDEALRRDNHEPISAK